MKYRVLLIIIIFAYGCSDCSTTEMARVTSKVEGLDAVLIARSCGGAIGSVEYSVYIVATGKNEGYSDEERVFYAVSHTEGLHLDWLNSDTLEIKYKIAHVDYFRNNIWLPSDNGGRYIEIREVPTTPPPSFDHLTSFK